MSGYNVAGHYNMIAEKYEEFESYNPRKHVLMTEGMLEALGSDFSGMSVLDIGCGNGYFSRLAKELGADYVHGIDISEKQLELARKKADAKRLDIVYEKADILDAKIGREFDLAIGGFVYNFFGKQENLQRAFENTYNHLKDKGRLFAIMCNPDNPTRSGNTLYSVSYANNDKFGDGAKLLCEFFDKNNRKLCHDYKFLWTTETVNRILDGIGFADIKWVDVKSSSEGQNIPRMKSTNILLFARKL